MSDNSLLIDAIGYIDDAYLEKYFEMKEDVVCRRKKHRISVIKRYVSIAACICIIVTVFVWFPYTLKKQMWETYETMGKFHVTDSESTQERSRVIGAISDENIDDYLGLSELGTVVIADTLKNAMESVNEDELIFFTVKLTETTNKEKAYIYDSFVKELGVTEDYMQEGVLYLTKNRIEALECPPDLALVLSLGVYPYE